MNEEQLLDMARYLESKLFPSFVKEIRDIRREEDPTGACNPTISISDITIYPYRKEMQGLVPYIKEEWWVVYPVWDSGDWSSKMNDGWPGGWEPVEVGPFVSAYEAIKAAYVILLQQRIDAIFETWGEV